MKISDMDQGNKFYVAGHRGWMARYPQNTLLSFKKAIELGVDMLEFDIRLSRDGVMMIMHDLLLENTTNGQGPLSDYTCAELKQLDAGGKFAKEFEGLKIPTFEELCDLVRPYPDLLLNIEIKTAPDDIEAADQAYAMVSRYGYLDRCVFNSFDARVVEHCHDRYQVRTHGFPAEYMQNFNLAPDGTYAKMWCIGLSMKWATPERVQEFLDRGIHPWCWSPDTEESALYALKTGLQLATCNDPAVMLRVAAQQGRR